MRKKNVYLLLCFLMIGIATMAQGNSQKASGVVTDENGTALSGVSISLSSGKVIGVTDNEGNFSVTVPSSATALKFSAIGFADTSEPIGQSMKVVLNSVTVSAGNDVVVTALGIKHQSKDLAYVAQTVSSADLNTVKESNFSNSLAGKAANVTITQGSGGAGAATNIILRGNNSLSGDGSPLIVIDGIPVVNENSRPSTGQSQFGQNFLAPDQLSTINPSDIEDVTILKGATAAALYGSQAANGAIIITTKSGKDGQMRVNFSTNTTFLSAAYHSKLQTEYGGAVADNGNYSWGDKDPNASYAGSFYKDLLQTGLNTSNAIDITTGTQKAQLFASYANTSAKGIIPNNSMNRNNFDLKGTGNLFNKFIEFTGKFSYVNQTIHNPYAPGSYLNPYYTMMAIPANTNMADYKKNYALDVDPYQNWPDFLVSGGIDNPYWDINKVKTTDNFDRMILSGNVKFNFTGWLNLVLRGNSDQTNEDYMNEMYQGTTSILASTTGGFEHKTTKTVQNYGDAILNFNKDLARNFHLTALVGGAVRDYKQTGIDINNNRVDLFQPNIFTTSNVDFADGGIAQDNYDRKQTQSLFYSFDFGYKNALFLTTTGRNDWSSTLPANKNNYFYPSVGVSAVLTDLFKELSNPTMNYLKLRASYTQVGNDLPNFIINPTSSVGMNGALSTPTTVIYPGTTLKPELTSSFEAGFDVNFFKNLVKLNATYYKSNTHDQLFSVSAPPSSGYTYYYVNGGNIQNEGVEVSLSVSPNLGQVKWTSTVNFSKNVNTVKSLVSGVDFFTYSVLTNSTSYMQEIVPGGSLGDFYATKFQRNTNGSYKMSSSYINGVQQDGTTPLLEDQPQKIGNAFPDFLLSWGNQFTYKGFRLSFLIDGHFGGKVISLTQAIMDASGNSIQTAKDRNQGYVLTDNGQQLTDVKAFYQAKGGIGGALGEYAYSATVVRLRELSLTYNLPASLFSKTKVIRGINVGLVGRNLFFFHKAAPIDPEIVSNNTMGQNAFLGLEMYNLPSTRNIGFSVNVNF